MNEHWHIACEHPSVMGKQNYIAAVLLMFGSLACPLVVSSQSGSTFTRTALARMDVFSRASLFERTMAEAARREGVDPLILWTIAYNETRFRPWLTSPRRAKGLMQFIPATAARFGLADPYEPNASIDAAARYVKYLSGLFDGRVDSILAAYNAGEGTVLAYLNGRTLSGRGKQINPDRLRTAAGIPPYRETISYVANGNRIYGWLRAQGKFDRIDRIPRIDDIGSTVSSDANLRAQANTSETVGVAVLYDPRTGNRYLVNRDGKLRSIEQSGAVIISPQVRSFPAQKARSTFTGIAP